MMTFLARMKIKEGKEADLVILNSNPLEDINATQDIFAVVNNGEVFDRQELDEILIKAEKQKIDLDVKRALEADEI